MNSASYSLLQINFDGVVFNDEDKAIIGVVIRDYKGMAIASMSQNITIPHLAVELEAFAAVRALEINIALAILEGVFEIAISAL